MPPARKANRRAARAGAGTVAAPPPPDGPPSAGNRAPLQGFAPERPHLRRGGRLLEAPDLRPVAAVEGLLQELATTILAAGNVDDLPMEMVLAHPARVRDPELGEQGTGLGRGQAGAHDRAVQGLGQLPDAVALVPGRLDRLREGRLPPARRERPQGRPLEIRALRHVRPAIAISNEI